MARLLNRLKRGAVRLGKASFSTSMVIRHGIAPKLAFEALALAVSPHTDGNDHAPGLDYEGALRIVIRAKREGLDTFDLWLVFDAYVCDNLDQAVEQLRHMHSIYEAPPR